MLDSYNRGLRDNVLDSLRDKVLDSGIATVGLIDSRLRDKVLDS